MLTSLWMSLEEEVCSRDVSKRGLSQKRDADLS
jgi:hypothetical protein